MPVVIDNGSLILKAGFGGDENPVAIFNNIVGRLKVPKIIFSKEQNKVYIDEKIETYNNILKVTCSIERGIITNWDDMEKIWQYTFLNKIKAKPDQHRVLLAVGPLNSKESHEKIAEIMFETFNVPAIYIANPPLLTLYASGRGSGIVVSSGDGVTHILPIYQGMPLPDHLEKINFGGKDITNYLISLLSKKCYRSLNNITREIIQKIKESMCYVALDFFETIGDKKNNHFEEKKYIQLPDGNELIIGNEAFQAPEALFQPKLCGLYFEGLGDVVYKSLLKCDPSLRSHFYSNIILAGGNTMFPGIGERLTKELLNTADPAMKIRVHSISERGLFVWIGGSIISSLSGYNQIWVTKNEYLEYGSSVIHRVAIQ